MSTATKSANVQFLSVGEFKTAIGMTGEPAQVVKNPNTGKLFLAIGSKNYKCQQEIDPSLEIKVLVENGNLEEACLTNVKASTANTVFTL